MVILCQLYRCSSADAIGCASDDGNTARLDSGVQIVCNRQVVYLVGRCAGEARAQRRWVATGAFRKHG